MTTSVFFLVLLAAALHAGWNAVVKRSDDTFVLTVAICIIAAVLATLALPFFTPPSTASWPYLAVSMVLQTVYYSLVAATYDRIDMSLAYPVMRGAAPMMVALIAGAAFGESMSWIGWLGIALISAGILSMAALGRSASRAGLFLALANACVIATYTLNDGWGVRQSGSAIGYTLWVSILAAPPVLAVALWVRGAGVLRGVVLNWRDGAIGGIGAMTSYGVALWAMTHAPVAMVAALRETSILFATAISALLLGERVGWRRIAAVTIIAGGAVTLRLA